MRLPRRRGRTEAQPLQIELVGLPAVPRIPSDLTIRHVIERKPGPAPARMWLVVNDRAGFRYQGHYAVLNNPNGHVSLQLPTGAQVYIKDRDSGQYIPLDRVDVEYTWGGY